MSLTLESRTAFFFGVLSVISLHKVSPLPQWVWNQDVVQGNNGNRGSSGSSQPFFEDKPSRFPSSAGFGDSLTTNNNIKVVSGASGTSRLIPGAIGNAISNSIQQGLGSFGSGSAPGGLIGAVLQSIPPFANIFNRPQVNLPEKNPSDSGLGSSGSGLGSSGSNSVGACRCAQANQCFLPNLQQGSCGGGRVQCCSNTRTVFPDEFSSGSSGSLGSFGSSTKNERTVTQRQVRRGLLQQILKGSGSLIDDTLDLIFTPYLSPEDQSRIATRVIPDE